MLSIGLTLDISHVVFRQCGFLLAFLRENEARIICYSLPCPGYWIRIAVSGCFENLIGADYVSESSNEHLDRLRAKKVNAEHRVLEQGDAVWIARSRKTPDTEYVLDYIIERKSFHDLIQSIRSKR